MTEQLDKGDDGGAIVGRSGGKLGFYGTTPIVTYATSFAVPLSTAAITSTATNWGYATSTQANQIALATFHITTLLANYGFATTSG